MACLLVMHSPQSGIRNKVHLSLLLCTGVISFPGVIGWITQLVVDKDVHKCYIAIQLMQTLKKHHLFPSVTIVGLVSSHPAACIALAKYAHKDVYFDIYFNIIVINTISRPHNRWNQH